MMSQNRHVIVLPWAVQYSAQGELLLNNVEMRRIGKQLKKRVFIICSI